MGGLIGRLLGRLSGHLFGRLFGTLFAQPRSRHSGDAILPLGCVRCPVLRVASHAQFCPDCSYCKLIIWQHDLIFYSKYNDMVGGLAIMRTALIGFVVPCPHANLEYSQTFPWTEFRLQFRLTPRNNSNKIVKNVWQLMGTVTVKWDIINNESGVEMLRSHVNLQYRG